MCMYACADLRAKGAHHVHPHALTHVRVRVRVRVHVRVHVHVGERRPQGQAVRGAPTAGQA